MVQSKIIYYNTKKRKKVSIKFYNNIVLLKDGIFFKVNQLYVYIDLGSKNTQILIEKSLSDLQSR